jgi:hypothetical protein
VADMLIRHNAEDTSNCTSGLDYNSGRIFTDAGIENFFIKMTREIL